MKKTSLILLVAIAIVALLAPVCRAQEAAEAIQENAQEDLASLLDQKTKDALQAFGMEDFRLDKVMDVSVQNITAFFASSLKENLQAVLRLLFSFLSLLLMLAAVRAIVPEEKAAAGVQLICVCGMILFGVTQLQPLVNAALSAMQVALNFMKGYVPIYAGILAFSGVPVSASFYSSFVFAVAELLSSFCSSGCVPLLGCYFALLIAFSLSPAMHVARFVNGVNKAMSVVLGFFATTFAALLGVRGVLASAMDAASVKSVRFLLSSLIPVVGSAISEAYSAVLGSINLIKGSVAVVGILVLMIISLPILLQTALTQVCFSALAVIAEVLECADLAATLRGFGTGIRFLVLLSVFQLFVLLIATGLMLSVKGGG